MSNFATSCEYLLKQTLNTKRQLKNKLNCVDACMCGHLRNLNI